MLNSVEQTLKEEGTFVLDFFNAHKVIANLVLEEKKEVEGVNFNITREVKEGCILKNINFETGGVKQSFQEKVQAITLNDFEFLFKNTKMKIIATFGNYSLEKFDQENSDRLIIIAQK